MAVNDSDGPPAAFIRALSDIYETTEPSLLQHTPVRPIPAIIAVAATSSNYSPTLPETPPNLHRIPPSAVPKRTSSRNHRKVPVRVASKVIRGNNKTDAKVRPERAPSSATISSTSPNQSGRGDTRERHACFSPTYDIPHPPLELLDDSPHSFSYIKLELRSHGSLYIGGSSVRGTVDVKVKSRAKSRQAQDSLVVGGTIDLLGFEETHNGDRAIFLALRSSLLESSDLHPMAATVNGLVHAKTPNDRPASSSQSQFLFSLRLPANTGPPVLSSRYAAIKFILCATVTFSETERVFHLRYSTPIQILPAYSFEAALRPLSRPLLLHDIHKSFRNDQQETLTINIRLSHHVWISGGSLFVDVHIANQTSKHVREITVFLEERTTIFHVPAASVNDRSETSGRVVKELHQKVVAKHKICKSICGWHGVTPHSSDMRSCDLDIPRSAATVRNTKLCKVEYVLNARARSSRHCVVRVQAPVTLIRLESLTALAPISHSVKNGGQQDPSRIHHGRNRAKESVHMHGSQSMSSRTHPNIDNVLQPLGTRPSDKTYQFGDNDQARHDEDRTIFKSETLHPLQRSSTGKKLESRSLSHLRTGAVELEKANLTLSDNTAGMKKMKLHRKRSDRVVARFPIKESSIRIPGSHSSADPLLKPKASWQIERNDDTEAIEQTSVKGAATFNDRSAYGSRAEDDPAEHPAKYAGQGGDGVVMHRSRIVPQSLQDFEKVKVDGNGSFLGVQSEQTWI